MSAHKFTQSAVSTARPQKRTPRQRQERDAIISKYGVNNMKKRCTAQNCAELAALIERKEQAETQGRWRDAGDIWLPIQAHECKGGA